MGRERINELGEKRVVRYCPSNAAPLRMPPEFGRKYIMW
jgi:hypothetical protein